MNQESGEETLARKETEEELAIEDELIAAIISNTQSSAGGLRQEDKTRP